MLEVGDEHAQHERLMVLLSDQAKLLESEQPTEKVELHAGAVVDALSVAPALVEVDAELGDVFFGQVGDAGVQVG